jgi:hypothetical protein
MILIDPRHYLADPTARPFIRDFRIDLTASDVPQESAGRYIVADLKVPRGQRFLVKSVMPYAMARTDVGTAQESARILVNEEVGGFFSFEPTVNGNSPFVIEADLNAMRTSAGAQNSDRVRANGWTHVSDNPWFQASASWDNPMFTVEVSPDSTFRIVFTVLPVGFANPLPNPYVIPAAPPPAAQPPKRVDFAGVVITGVNMSDQSYRDIYRKVEQQGVGPA